MLYSLNTIVELCDITQFCCTVRFGAAVVGKVIEGTTLDEGKLLYSDAAAKKHLVPEVNRQPGYRRE